MSKQLSEQELSEIVDIVLLVGQAMLQSGAATFRTEETMARIGLGMGAERLELYVTPTGIIATAVSGQEQRTRVGRVGPLGVNMAHADAFNQFSRHVSLVGVSVDAARRRLETINTMPRELPSWATILAVAVACGAFSQILGAGWAEFVAAMIGAGVAQFLRMRMLHAGVNPFAMTVLCAWAGSMIAWGICQIIPNEFTNLAVIASVLLLVPGVPLVTSVIDLTNYDLVSGVTRGTLAFLLALSIGIGVLLTLAITGLRLV